MQKILEQNLANFWEQVVVDFFILSEEDAQEEFIKNMSPLTVIKHEISNSSCKTAF